MEHDGAGNVTVEPHSDGYLDDCVCVYLLLVRGGGG